MMTEDYVSFETAKLLKEKGFDWIVDRSFFEHDNFYAPCDPSEVSRKDAIAIPTLQMAMKWLREVHNIHVVPKFDFYAGYYTGRIYDGRRETVSEKDDYIAIVGYETYENACEEAIKYCLENLI